MLMPFPSVAQSPNESIPKHEELAWQLALCVFHLPIHANHPRPYQRLDQPRHKLILSVVTRVRDFRFLPINVLVVAATAEHTVRA